MSREQAYYHRRALVEMSAARRALTPAAMKRRQQLADAFMARVSQLSQVAEMAETA